jgi:N-acetylglucosamine-6-phosphate deacetylase
VSLLKGLKNVSYVSLEGVKRGNIEFSDGLISQITENSNFDGLELEPNLIVIPGFIDEHIHGVHNHDVMDGTIESISEIAKALVKEGITSFLATTMTQSVEAISKALVNVRNYMNIQDYTGAEVLGIHLEGPFLNEEACGAQPKKYIVNPSVEQFKAYQVLSGNQIRFVTVAPENDGGIDMIKYCKSNDVVASIGHTKANYEQTLEAIQAGASSVTHCYNAMTGLHHRDIGVVGAALLHEELQAELIADGIHVQEKAIELLYRNKGKQGITLVTDSMRAKGLEDGNYDLGGQNVFVHNGEARLANGTLAGSTLFMNKAIANMIKFLNLKIVDVVMMASTNPAKKLGIFDRKGSIEVGKDADLVVLNEKYEVVMTICKGNLVYKKEK